MILPNFADLSMALSSVEVEDGGFLNVVRLARLAQSGCRRLIFIGNGGSAAIAQHMAADFTKNCKVAALSLTDPATLTAVTNDEGFGSVYATQIAQHGRTADMLFAISSSGASGNILTGVCKAKKLGLHVVTLSGFAPGNPLRREGDVNFYVPSSRYGIVEVAHHAILHAVVDQVMAA